jgi:putative hemolysin
VNDILEAIVGEIPQRGETDARQIIVREDGTWLVDGMLSVDELKDFFAFSSLPDEEVADFQTVGGFMMTALGRVPAVTDEFQWAGYHFEIVDMDGMRVDKILIRKEIQT